MYRLGILLYLTKHAYCRVSNHKAATIIGFFSSLGLCLPFDCFYLMHLYECLISIPGWQSKVILTNMAQIAIKKYWSVFSQYTYSCGWFFPLSPILLCIDACSRGWGAWLRYPNEVVQFFSRHGCLLSQILLLYQSLAHFQLHYKPFLSRTSLSDYFWTVLQLWPWLIKCFLVRMNVGTF